MALREAAATRARVTLRSMVVLLELCAFDVFVLARVLSFSLTHRQSVACLTERVRGFRVSFAFNFLNDYSGVKNITQASNRYYCSGFRLRRFALR
jgi:hypothetical protein